MMAGGLELLIVMGFGAFIAVMLLGGLGKNRPGMAILFGGLAFLGLLLGAGLLWALVGYRAVGHVNTTPIVYDDPTITALPAFTQHNVHTNWSFSFGGLFLAGAIIAILVFGARRHGAMAHAASAHRRIWPFVLIPLAALFFLGTMRVQSKRTNYPPPPVAVNTYPPAPPAAPRPQEAIVKSVEATQSSLQKQQAELAQNIAKSQMEVEKRIAKMDIHELMDKVDAPRIALVPAVPEVPDAPRPSSSDKEENESPGTKATIEAALDAETTEKAGRAGAEERRGENNKTQKKEQNTRADNKDVNDENPGNAEAPLPSTKEITDELAAKVIVRRPAWVDAPPKRVGEKAATEVLVTDEWSTKEECERARDIGLMLNAYERIQRMIGAPYHKFQLDHRMASNNSWNDHRLVKLALLGVTVDYLHREVAKDEFLERTERSVGPMMKYHTLIEYSPDVDRYLRERWDAYSRQTRFAMVGMGATAVLGLLGMVFGLLKIDTWTKGYYTKRLFIGVPAAIIGVFLIALLIDIAA